MPSVRRLQRSALLCFGGLAGIATLFATACGSSGGSGGDSPTGGPPGSDAGGPNVTGDAAVSPDGSGGPSVDGPFVFRDRLAGWSGGYTGGFYPAHGYAISGDRLFSVPDALSSTLGAVTLVDVSVPAKPRVYALPVTGTFPSGSVEAFVYDPASDRVVMIVRPVGTGAKPVVVTLALGDKAATFTTFTQAGVAITSNALIGPLYASGAPGVIVVGLGGSTATFTLAGTTATWSAATDGSLYAPTNTAALEDPAHGRILAYGKLDFDPVAKTSQIDPTIQTLALAPPPYQWTALPSGGDAPPVTSTLGTNGFAVYDGVGNRVLASVPHQGTCGNVPCVTQGLWSFDLGTMAWTKVQDPFFGPNAYNTRPFLVDQATRRILAPSDGVLHATTLDTAVNPMLSDAVLVQDGDLGPVAATVATVLPDGRILSTDGGVFRVLDPSVSTPHWQRFGTVTMPAALAGSGSLSADPKTGETLVLGQSSPGSAAVMQLYVLSADGKTIKPVAFDAAPPVRSSYAALVVDGTLYVAGGYGPSPGPTATAVDDVWAFDRASSKWTQIATLPIGVASGTLSLGPKGELLVMGRIPPGTNAGVYANSKVFAIDRTSHAVSSLDAVPSKYALWSLAPFRGCFVGYESQDVVDGSQKPTFWRCTMANGAITWTSTTLDEHDFALNELHATAAADGLHAYFVGRHVWEAIGK